MIVSPQRLDDPAIKNFVIAKKNWIEKKRHKYQQQNDIYITPSLEYKSGEIHYYKGDRLLLICD